jgi:hypothetical protein
MFLLLSGNIFSYQQFRSAHHHATKGLPSLSFAHLSIQKHAVSALIDSNTAIQMTFHIILVSME